MTVVFYERKSSIKFRSPLSTHCLHEASAYALVLSALTPALCHHTLFSPGLCFFVVALRKSGPPPRPETLPIGVAVHLQSNIPKNCSAQPHLEPPHCSAFGLI